MRPTELELQCNAIGTMNDTFVDNAKTLSLQISSFCADKQTHIYGVPNFLTFSDL